MKTLRDRRLGETLLCARGPGGLALRLVPKRGFAEKLAVLAVDYGSNDLVIPGGRRTPPGIAHFLEHTLFETARGNASDLFSQRGAYSNAFTDYTTTAYLFSAPNGWRENLALLLDFVFHPPFPPDKVEKERGIIQQELRMYRDSPASRLTEGLHQALYQRHPVRIDIGGTRASVRAIRRRDLVACHRAFYAPANMCLVAVGDLRMEDLLEASSGRVPRRGGRRALHALPREPSTVRRVRASARLEVAQPQALIGFKDPRPAASGPSLLSRRIAVGLCLSLLFDRTAPLYQFLYGEGLIDEDFGAAYLADRRFGYGAVGGKTKDPEGLRLKVLEALARARQEGFREKDMALTKKKALGSYIRLFDSPQGLASSVLSAHFLGVPLFDYPRRLAACGAGDLSVALEECLSTDRHALSVIWPKGQR